MSDDDRAHVEFLQQLLAGTIKCLCFWAAAAVLLGMLAVWGWLR